MVERSKEQHCDISIEGKKKKGASSDGPQWFHY